MALSDHDQTVLREMELMLRADTTRSAIARPSTHRRPRRYLAAAIGLSIAGVVCIAVGLRLQDNFGTGFGVFGFLLIVGSCVSGTRLLDPLPGWMTTHDDRSARKPR